VRAAFSGLLNETVEPSTVISPRGLLRARKTKPSPQKKPKFR